MRSITEGNLLLSRVFHMPASAAAPAPAVEPPAAIPFTTLPEGSYQTGPAVRELRQTNFLAQADAAAKMPIQLPPGAVPLGTGAMADCFTIAPLSEASLPDWDEAVKVLDRGNPDEIVALVQSVSPAMAALLMGHIKPAAPYYAGLVRRLIFVASHDILTTDPEDEPAIDEDE